MTALERCERVLGDAQRVVERVQPDDLGKLTTCTDWNVRALVNHMLGVLEALESPARGESMTFNPQDETDFIGGDPAGAFSKRASAFMAAWKAPGATDRVVTTMFGEQPAG